MCNVVMGKKTVGELVAMVTSHHATLLPSLRHVVHVSRNFND